MAVINIGTLTDIEKSKYVKEGLEFAKYQLIYRQFGQKDNVEERAGKTIQWIRFTVPAVTSGSDFTGAATYVKNTTGASPTFTPATPDETAVTASPDYLFGKGHEWTNGVGYTSFMDIKKELRQINAEHAGRSVDTEVRNIVDAGTTVAYANAKANRGLLDSADKIDLYDLFSLATTMRNNSTRTIEGLLRVMHSHNVTEQLFKDSVLQSAIQLQKNYMFVGTIAEIYGFGFTPTENAPTVSNSGSNNAVATVEQTVVAGKGGYGVTYWEKNDYDIIYTGPGGWADEWANRNALTWKFSGKAVILNQSWVGRLESSR